MRLQNITGHRTTLDVPRQLSKSVAGLQPLEGTSQSNRAFTKDEPGYSRSVSLLQGEAQPVYLSKFNSRTAPGSGDVGDANELLLGVQLSPVRFPHIHVPLSWLYQMSSTT